MSTTPHPPRRRVLVAGGGVAALEVVLALRHLAGRQVAIELLAPEREFVHRPASVAVPFGFGAPHPVALDEIARRHDLALRRDGLAGVDPDRRVAITATGSELPYDMLVVATGARQREALPGALTFGGPADVPALERLLASVARGEIGRLAFAAPRAVTWSLPIYELALMAVAELRNRGVQDPAITVVTHEPEPLWVFGPAAGAAVRNLLSARGISLETDCRTFAVRDGKLGLETGGTIDSDAVVALPAVEGPGLQGLPADENGFLPVDAHGRVTGLEGVFAAGDATSFPLKQGGLATQQADAVAESIAAAVGALADPQPFRPVLRGLLLTGGAPLYLRAELSASGELRRAACEAAELVLPRPIRPPISGEASTRALWWPPGKVAGRYLAPYLATARPPSLGEGLLSDRTSSASPGGDGERDAALELALLLADADAERRDYRQALHALDAAAALAGGVLPADYADRREIWTRLAGDPQGVL